MLRESGYVRTIELPLTEYDELKRKEFVFNLEKSRLERSLKDGKWVDTDRLELYGVPSKEELLKEALADIRGRMESEKAAYHWEEVTE